MAYKKIMITQTSNGYHIVDHEGGYFLDSEDTYNKEYVVQEPEDLDSDETDHRTLKELFHLLQDLLEVYSSKHNKYNCRVKLEDQDGKEVI